MAKKKKTENKQQKTLFAFMDKAKPTKQPDKEVPKKEETKKEKLEKPAKQISDKIKEPSEIKPIPKNLFFKRNDTPFGLKEDDIKLTRIQRESVSSKYIRYLIEKGNIVQDLEKGMLLDVDYDGGQNKAYCKFYDLDSEDIKIWIDTTSHEPYCLSKESIAELENNIKLTNFEGLVRFEEIKRMDLLRDKEITMTKIYGKTPIDIGGSGNNIRNILNREAWEADIRYHLNYIFDTGLIPGLIYSIKNGKIEKINIDKDKKESEQIANELMALFKDEKPEIQEFAERYLDIFLTPIPDIKRMALDIEVNVGQNDYNIPDPRQAKQEIISISFVATDGLKLVYMLEREGFTYEKPYKEFPPDAKTIFFKSEKELLTETFRLMWEYPVIITFNGDNFDLNYMFHRANKLKIDRDLNPIHIKRGFGFLSRAECNLRRGIHIDIFNFFFNRSISGYAFSGAYERNSLNAISAALLSQEKYSHEEEIQEMEYNVLSWYNLKDSILTLELTKFNNSLVWNLLILLCRITKMPMHDMVRHQISAWIQNLFFFEHRQKGYLIPRRSEISELKRGGYSKSIIEGKGFKGAYVIPPVRGIHYNVVVMDFSSLYPSIIKEYNLSYETVQCPHDNCNDNLIKGIPYHVCTYKMGIFSYIVGFFRDIRVKYFKPKSGDKNLSVERRSYNNTIQQALKVFINGCLPFEEEIIIKKPSGMIQKCKIGSLKNKWKDLEVLSIKKSSESFGSSIFVSIKNFTSRKANKIINFRLSDGREFRCTPNHIIPKITPSQRIEEVEAEDLKIDDEVMVFHNIPFSTQLSDHLFIPNFLNWENRWVGIKRDNYKRFSYRTNQQTNVPLIQLINDKFHYSKVSKIYKTQWNNLTESEKEFIEQVAISNNVEILVKIHDQLGRWYSSIVPLSSDFFKLLGWYVAEGSDDNNRTSITQSKAIHPENYAEIIEILEQLNFPYSFDDKKVIRINSNVYTELIISICSKLAENKTIPFEMLDKERANAFMDAYFKGDGNLIRGKWKRYSTISRQLKNDLVTIIGALGGYASIKKPSPSDKCYRVIETEGRKYKRKNIGLINYYGTTPVRIKSIEISNEIQDVFDIETGNGWFIATNGIIVHNSYGVFGSKNFPLFCLPVAESTTGIGQYSIKATIEKCESMGVKVLYGDTDSVFLLSPTKKQMSEISEWSKKELDLDLEEEKTYQFLALSDRKKNYVGIYKDSKYIDIKGLVAKKRNTPNFIKKVFNQLIDILKEITNDNEFKQARNRIIEIIRENQKKIGKPDTFSLEDYAINIAMQKMLKSYDKVIPQHVRAALELKNITGKEFQKGEVISFIKSKGSIGAKAIELAKLQDINTKKYQELLQSALEQLLDALGISFEEIKGIKKMDAFF